MAHNTHQPYPPRWAMIYMMLILLAIIAWVVIDVIHGGPPWEHQW